MQPSLAKELYYETIHHVFAVSDLQSLALTCSDFQGEVQRLLFHTVALASVARQMRFVSTISARPSRFAPLVQTLRIGSAKIGRSKIALSQRKGLIMKCASALRPMGNLKRLEIYHARLRKIMDGCSFKLQ